MPEPVQTLPIEETNTLAHGSAVPAFEKNENDRTRHLQLVGPTAVTMGVSDTAEKIRRLFAKWERGASLSLERTIAPSSRTLSIWGRDVTPSPPVKGPPRHFGQLLAAIEAEAVEDGVTHVGEELISEIVSSGEAGCLVDATIATNTSVAASIVQLLGRVAPIAAQSSRVALMEYALGSTDIQLRDAAVQAIELWEDKSMISLLQSHQEPVAWLNQYVIEVLEDLQG